MWRSQQSDENRSIANQKLKAAIKLQRAYRLSQIIYKRFGPDLFCTRSGGAAPHGKLIFPAAGSMGRNLVPWVCLAETSKLSLVCNYFDRYWRLDTKDLFIDVAGSAVHLNIDPQLTQAIVDGLETVMRGARCGIFTEGLDGGVTQLVSTARRKSGEGTTIIGMPRWGNVLGWEALLQCNGEELAYQHIAMNAGAREANSSVLHLSPNHSHFLMVDSGDVAKVPTRHQIVDAYADRKGVPTVMIVIQGGCETLTSVLAAAKGGRPVVCVVGSGGAADAVYQYVFMGREASRELNGMGSIAVAQLDAIRNLHLQSNRTLITPFNRLEVQGSSLDRAVLNAVVTSMTVQRSSEGSMPDSQPDLQKTRSLQVINFLRGSSNRVDPVAAALKLAIAWDRADTVRDMIENELRATQNQQARTILSTSLHRALERRRVGTVQLLVELNTPFDAIKLERLYVQPDRYNFLSADTELKHFLHSTDRLVQYRGIAEFLGDIAPLLEKLAMDNLEDSEPKADTARDVFFWAILCGHDEIARAVWRRCNDPLHVAILGSFICKNQASRIKIGQTEVLERAASLEADATAVVACAQTEEMVHAVLLGMPGTTDHYGSLLDLALQCRMKNFVSQDHCQILGAKQWVGATQGSVCRLKPDFSWCAVAVCSLLPFLFPLLLEEKGPRSRNAGRAKGWTLIRRVLLRNPLLRHASTASPIDYSLHECAQAMANALQASNLKRSRNSAQSRGSAAVSSRCARASTIDTEDDAVDLVAEMKAARAMTTSICVRLGAFYGIPAVKFCTRCCSHMGFVALHFVVLTRLETHTISSSVEPSAMLPDGPEICLAVFWIAIFLDRCHRGAMLWQQQMVGSFTGSDMASRLWAATNIIYTVAFAVRGCSYVVSLKRLSLPDIVEPYDLHRIYTVLLALNSLPISFNSMQYLSINEDFGVLSVMIGRMARDTALWLLLMAVLYVGFVGVFMGLDGAGLYVRTESPDVGSSLNIGSDAWQLNNVHVRSLTAVQAGTCSP